jgi:alkaline phosphatase D
MKKIIITLIVFSAGKNVSSQIISGPMLGHVELRTAKIWVETVPDTKLSAWVWEKDKQRKTGNEALVTKNSHLGFETAILDAVHLKYGTAYTYEISAVNKKGTLTKVTGSFTTQDFWQYRKPVPDVTLLAGSCAYIADTAYDRMYTDLSKLDKLATPYGGDPSIFETMANTPANAMLWLGDNWYTREADYHSAWGLNERASHDRKIEPIQKLLKAMPQYAIWDDHDFGPNDCDKSYHLTNESREAFKRFWANPSYGNGEKGVYSKATFADVDLFLLDDRTWRSNDNMADSINGLPNGEKRMFGYEQIDWLKNQLLTSKATFKIIATGSQVLNPRSPYDAFRKFPAEYLELMQFLQIEKIKGVLFFTGDRHHTEVIKVNRAGTYPLYDITISPLTSGTHKFSGPEKDNPYREFGIDQLQNFGIIKVTGPLNDRKMTISFKGTKGNDLGSWTVAAKELR